MKYYSPLIPAMMAFLMLTLDAQAQRPEKLGGEASFMPATGLEKDGDLSIHQEAVKGLVPVWHDTKGQTKLSIGGLARRTEFLFDDAGEWTDTVVYELGVPLQAQRMVSSNLTWSLLAMPGLASDLKQVDGEDFRLTVLGLGTYQAGPEWRWVGGLYYGQAFGETRFFPAIGTVWTPSREWAVSILMPRPGITYTPSRSWSFTALVQPAGGDWNVEKQNEAPNLILETWRAGVEAGWSLNPGVQLFAETGYAFNRSLELRDGSDTTLKDTIDPGTYFRAGIRIY